MKLNFKNKKIIKFHARRNLKYIILFRIFIFESINFKIHSKYCYDKLLDS